MYAWHLMRTIVLLRKYKLFSCTFPLSFILVMKIPKSIMFSNPRFITLGKKNRKKKKTRNMRHIWFLSLSLSLIFRIKLLEAGKYFKELKLIFFMREIMSLSVAPLGMVAAYDPCTDELMIPDSTDGSRHYASHWIVRSNIHPSPIKHFLKASQEKKNQTSTL